MTLRSLFADRLRRRVRARAPLRLSCPPRPLRTAGHGCVCVRRVSASPAPYAAPVGRPAHAGCGLVPGRQQHIPIDPTRLAGLPAAARIHFRLDAAGAYAVHVVVGGNDQVSLPAAWRAQQVGKQLQRGLERHPFLAGGTQEAVPERTHAGRVAATEPLHPELHQHAGAAAVEVDVAALDVVARVGFLQARRRDQARFCAGARIGQHQAGSRRRCLRTDGGARITGRGCRRSAQQEKAEQAGQGQDRPAHCRNADTQRLQRASRWCDTAPYSSGDERCGLSGLQACAISSSSIS